MELKTFVKVGNISNLSDARYCAGMGVHLLGFNLDDGNDSIGPDMFREISGWLAGTAFAGEFEHSSLEHIINISTSLELDFVQVNTVDLANNLSERFQVIFKIEMADLDDFTTVLSNIQELDKRIKYVLIESDSDDLSSDIDELLSSLSTDIPILKGYNVTEHNILASLDKFNISGIALKGSVEIRPGFKDYDELADILEALEVED